MSAYSSSTESTRAKKNESFFSKISSKLTTFWDDLTSDGSDDADGIMEADEFLEEEPVAEFYQEEPVGTAPSLEESIHEEEERVYSRPAAEAPQETYGAKKNGVYGSKAQENAPEFHDDAEVELESDVEDEVDFEITPKGLRSEIQFTGTYRSTERVAVASPSSIGFDLPKNSAGATPPVGSPSGTTSQVGYNGKSAPSNHPSTIIQFFEPHETKQADEICSVLKAGAIVIVNLQNVKEEGDKLRIIDFVSGCCKGIDAKVQMVASKSIFVAAPKGIELRKPVAASETTGDISGDSTGNSSLFSGFNFGVPGSERSTNSFMPKF